MGAAKVAASTVAAGGPAPRGHATQKPAGAMQHDHNKPAETRYEDMARAEREAEAATGRGGRELGAAFPDAAGAARATVGSGGVDAEPSDADYNAPVPRSAKRPGLGLRPSGEE